VVGDGHNFDIIVGKFTADTDNEVFVLAQLEYRLPIYSISLVAKLLKSFDRYASTLPFMITVSAYHQSWHIVLFLILCHLCWEQHLTVMKQFDQ
jgi:hypothetical protein